MVKIKTLMDRNTYPKMSKSLDKDLNKVLFDWENHSEFEDDFPSRDEGYHELAPGFHVYFAWAGGDWEWPVSWVFYWDGTEIRAYIPKDGNTWNKQLKCAYGSEYEKGGESDENKDYSVEYNVAAMKLDILNRIKEKPKTTLQVFQEAFKIKL